MASERSKLNDKYNGLVRQINAHKKKYEEAVERDDFYAAKNAIADMIDFHNERCKINDQARRRTKRGEFEVHAKNVADRVPYLRRLADKYELSHRHIEDY